MHPSGLEEQQTEVPHQVWPTADVGTARMKTKLFIIGNWKNYLKELYRSSLMALEREKDLRR
jgi:hypothetical protein